MENESQADQFFALARTHEDEGRLCDALDWFLLSYKGGKALAGERLIGILEKMVETSRPEWFYFACTFCIQLPDNFKKDFLREISDFEYRLGVKLISRQGLEASIPFLERAALAEHPHASQLLMNVEFNIGRELSDSDSRRACDWLERAMMHGHPGARQRLMELELSNGNKNAKSGYDEWSLAWYEEAALLGSREAMLQLSRCLRIRGQLNESLEWERLAEQCDQNGEPIAFGWYLPAFNTENPRFLEHLLDILDSLVPYVNKTNFRQAELICLRIEEGTVTDLDFLRRLSEIEFRLGKKIFDAGLDESSVPFFGFCVEPRKP